MLVTSWNVNSVTIRLEALLNCLETVKPDVLYLQKTKTIDAKFPVKAFQQLW